MRSFERLFTYACMTDDVTLLQLCMPYLDLNNLYCLSAILHIVDRNSINALNIIKKHLKQHDIDSLISYSMNQKTELWKDLGDKYDWFYIAIFHKPELCNDILNNDFYDECRFADVTSACAQTNNIKLYKKYLQKCKPGKVSLSLSYISFEMLKLVCPYLDIREDKEHCFKHRAEELIQLFLNDKLQMAIYYYNYLKYTPEKLNEAFYWYSFYRHFTKVPSVKTMNWLKALKMRDWPTIRRRIYCYTAYENSPILAKHLKCKVKSFPGPYSPRGSINSIFNNACKKGDLEGCKWLLKTYGINRGKNCANTITITSEPFCKAIKYGSYEICEWLMTLATQDLNIRGLVYVHDLEQFKWLEDHNIIYDHSYIATYGDEELIDWIYDNKREIMNQEFITKLIFRDYHYGLEYYMKLGMNFRTGIEYYFYDNECQNVHYRKYIM